MRCNVASVSYIMLRLQLLIKFHWSLKRTFMMKLLKNFYVRILYRLNFWAPLVLIVIIIFFIFKNYLKSQIEKKLFFKFEILLYVNYREKLLWFNTFFPNLRKFIPANYLTFWHSFNSRSNFLDCEKLFLRTLFFSMKHCLQNFPIC